MGTWKSRGLRGSLLEEEINQAKQSSPKQMLKTILVRLLPKKLVELWIEQGLMQDEVIANISKVRVKNLVDFIHHWEFTPNGTEGYRTAEVTWAVWILK